MPTDLASRGGAPVARRVTAGLGRRLIGMLVGLVLIGRIWAVQPYTPTIADPLLDPLQWQKIPELDGKSPQCMVEAKDGAMWFGVGQGLLRYDGMNWTSYQAAEGVVDAAVTALMCTRDGRIFAGSERGIICFERGRWTHVFDAPASYPVRVDKIIEVSDGSVWAALNKCFLKLGPGGFVGFAEAERAAEVAAAFPQVKVVPFPEEVPLDNQKDFQRRAICETSNGWLWFGLERGSVVRFDARNKAPGDPTALHVFSEAEGFHAGARPSFFEANDGRLWIGNDVDTVGMNRYDPASQRWTYFRFSDLMGTDDLVWSIMGTRDGTLWVGGFTKIFRYRDGQWRVYRTSDAPLSTARSVLLESRDGFLWVLGERDNVQKIDPQGVRWTRFEGLNFQCETPDGSQWFLSGDGGVVRYDGKTWQRYDREDGLITTVNALLCTRKGQLWAAGSHEGKAATGCFDGARWSVKCHDQFKPAFGFLLDHRAVFEAANGSLWFACYVDAGQGGLLEYNPALGSPQEDAAWKNFRSDPEDQLFRNRTSYGFGQLTDGRIFSGSPWLLMVFDGQHWANSSFLSDQRIDVVTTTPDQKYLWLSTRGQGVARYDGKALVRYEAKDGLLSNAVSALLCDREGGVWAASSKGVSHFDGNEWTAVFNEERIFMGFEGGGFRQSADGALWINQFSREWLRRDFPGGKRSEVATKSFRTVRYRPDHASPKTEFTSVLRKVSQPGNTVASWRGLAPWWRSKESDLRFSYRLDGAPWSRFTYETNHVFLQLPSGKRVLEVRAIDRDLNIEPVPARMEFVVLPPVWQEPWFVALMALLIGAVATQTLRVIRRGRRLAASNLQLEQKSRQLEEQKSQLEVEIDQRKKMEVEVERTHAQLMLASRQAGMAEVAINVLHNVGNVLNSLNVSCDLMLTRLRGTRFGMLGKVADLLAEHAHAPDFLAANPKGKQIPAYLRKYDEHSAAEHGALLTELLSLQSNVEHVKEIVRAQQDFSSQSNVVEKIKVSALLEEAIRMNTAALERHGVKLVREIQGDATVEVEKHKVLQILVNLIVNAKQACDESGREDKVLTCRVRPAQPGSVQIQIIDTGVGIRPENLTRIFNHGFTTRKEGHGFGLHSSANTAIEMGGRLTASSDGPGQGATFTLEIPLRPPRAK